MEIEEQSVSRLPPRKAKEKSGERYKNFLLKSFCEINSTKRQNSRLVQIETFCRRQNRCDLKIEICF